MSCLFRKTECHLAFPPTELSDQWLRVLWTAWWLFFPLFMKPYRYKYRVPFQDTDMAGVVHFTRILGYAELAEHACLDELGIAVISEQGGFPKVNVECDYLSPLKFGDTVEIELSLGEILERSLHWGFDITTGGKLCARGRFVSVYVNSMGESTGITSEWKNILEESLGSRVK